MTYVDGFVLAVPTANKEAYRALSEACGVVFKDHGALSMTECWGDDVPEGKLTSFPMAVKLEKGETVVFSWIIWPSKAARDSGMKASMGDKRFTDMSPDSMPFDGKRMIMGGFDVLVDV